MNKTGVNPYPQGSCISVMRRQPVNYLKHRNSAQCHGANKGEEEGTEGWREKVV